MPALTRAVQKPPLGVLLVFALASCAEATESPDPCWIDPTSCGGGGTGGSSGQGVSGSPGGAPTGGTSGAMSTGGAGRGVIAGAGGAAGGSAGGGAASGGGKGGTAGASAAGGGGTLSGGAAGTGGTSGGGTAGNAGSSGSAGAAGAGGSGACTGGGTAPVCLAHRYSFDGTGMAVMDSVGTRHATAVGASMASGAIALGGTEQYVTLPSGLVSRFTDATFEAWVTWAGGNAIWQRIFDFGSNTEATGDQGAGTTYLFLTPRNGATQVVRAALSLSGTMAETFVDGAAPLPSTAGTHVAVVVGAQSMTLFVNGAAVGSVALAQSLGSLMDTHNWLGRSQFAPDPEFAGSIQEFRIYGVARTAAQIQASFSSGPDVLPLQ